MTRLALTLAFSVAAIPALAQEVADGASLAQAAQGADIVILGEVHDNPGHHALQAAAVEAIGPTALVFEMLSQEAAASVTPALAADDAALEAALTWSESGWPDFAMYYPLIAFARSGPIYGAQIDRSAAQAAFAHGAAVAFGPEAAQFGLATALPADQQATREAEQMAAHCDALPEDILPGFVEAQRLRDASLAQAALGALETHGAPVVIITGNGHARRDWGIPSVLAAAAPDLRVVTLGQFEAPPEGEIPFDLWAMSDPVARPDPCAAFR
jgi:uncharacterized iron-regulated protein